MKTEKTIGILLIVGVIGIFVPYTILTMIFEYPTILRQDTGTILVKFYNGGNTLIWTWWAFAILGLPILEACILIGQKLESKFYFVRWATILGVIGLMVQVLGLLRWTFVVPVLAKDFVLGNEMTKEAVTVAFKVVHQYGGIILGEHIGQLFTIGWTVMITSAFEKLKLFPKWIIWLGYAASIIYLFAQAGLFSTVIPNFPVWNIAGFLGSTLWLIWLLIIGFKFIKTEIR
ncbi:DUF4386 domain-containing protein [Arenibacter sp. N53]|uniref:DUF4386 domain-containing protein n=1 Tax=Arenibacter TaxID=178469 RepID=UPI000CD450F6|nr:MULTISPECIES: DUF4386 domain-containing protein [Arenibacter]MCM4153963.1 DUF4386 domain-containing protein [Arenibacter sp. N53]